MCVFGIFVLCKEECSSPVSVITGDIWTCMSRHDILPASAGIPAYRTCSRPFSWSTKWIQPARGWCAAVGGHCANCNHLSYPQHTNIHTPPTTPQHHPSPLFTFPSPLHHTPAHCHTRNKQNTPKTKHKEIKILQLNANGIRSTVEELKHLIHTTQPDIITIQESKLTSASRTLQIPHFTAIRTDREHKQCGGLITYIISDTTFTHIKTPQVINTDNTETS